MTRMPLTNRREILKKIGATGLCTTPLLGSAVFAATFMELEQAQKLLVPQADSFSAVTMPLDDAKLNEIAKATDTRIPKNFNPKIWRADLGNKPLGWVITDRVIGKYDLIDFAAGFQADGTSIGLEILAYRESHGSEVKQSAWRKQFTGKKSPATMRFADDIRNISGATLSCQHVTEGMQRLSAVASLLSAGK
jgi:Na+-translocating ferredoxin:NAD+ oxidoreductase RnfG subunit